MVVAAVLDMMHLVHGQKVVILTPTIPLVVDVVVLKVVVAALELPTQWIHPTVQVALE